MEYEPYTYDSCDIGTFSSQTLKDHSSLAAALSSGQRQKKNTTMSYRGSPGRSSRVSFPALVSLTLLIDSAWPSISVDLGAPEIDIFEAEKDKLIAGQVVS